MSEKPIAVAMSGGVDSSVVAGLLQARGENVIGLTMQLWNQRRLPEIQSDKATGRCCSLDDVYDARAVAQTLGIPYYVVNFERDFEDQVVKPFIQDYLAGRTPVPCTRCNNFIKFDQFLEMAAGVGAERIATGHYARIRWNADSGRWEMLRSVDRGKDQTYFLFGLKQEQLARTMFPLGGMEKTQVRELAREPSPPLIQALMQLVEEIHSTEALLQAAGSLYFGRLRHLAGSNAATQAPAAPSTPISFIG